MKVVANGRDYEVEPGTSAEAFLRERGLEPRFTVVELGGEPLRRDSYATTILRPGDRLELVRAVAGGSGGARDGRWRRARLTDSGLYCCLDRRAGQRDLAGFLDTILAAGVDIVQLRDKEATPDQLRESAAVFREAAALHGALFVLNDDPALAAEVGADGVHVGQDDPHPTAARAAVGSQRLVGRSTHTLAEIDAALTEDCDYFAIGPVHATPTKQGRSPIGLEPLRHAARVAPDPGPTQGSGEGRPWFVTGGMAPDTAPVVLATGARRLVVVRALAQAGEPGAAAGELSRLLRGAAGVNPGGVP